MVLWVLAQITIIATDIPQVLGTAIGLKMLFNLPLVVGVVLTSLDTLVFLLVQV
jgi:manganese transport protein